mgnify:CR=1 FL=1
MCSVECVMFRNAIPFHKCAVGANCIRPSHSTWTNISTRITATQCDRRGMPWHALRIKYVTIYRTRCILIIHFNISTFQHFNIEFVFIALWIPRANAIRPYGYVADHFTIEFILITYRKWRACHGMPLQNRPTKHNHNANPKDECNSPLHITHYTITHYTLHDYTPLHITHSQNSSVFCVRRV